MNDITIFINHIINNKIQLHLWYLTYYGNLSLNIFSIENNKCMWKNNTLISTISITEMKDILHQYLLDYDLNWIQLLQYYEPIFLTYSYMYNNEIKQLTYDYIIPYQKSTYIPDLYSFNNNEIIDINIEIHNKYLEEKFEYNSIIRAIINLIKKNNPVKFNNLNFKLNDNPPMIKYIY